MKKLFFKKFMAMVMIFLLLFTMPGFSIKAYAEDAGSGYVTDSNNIMAYKYLGGNFDIHGYYSGSWLQTTFGNGGFELYLKSDGASIGEQFDASAEGSDVDGFNISINFSFANEGKLLGLTYTVINNNDGERVFSLGTCADVQIGDDDSALITPFDDNSGFKMVNVNGNYVDSQFNFFGKNCLDATDVDAFWYGKYYDEDRADEGYCSNKSTYAFKTDEHESGDFDSAMSFSWNNRIIAAGETQIFKTYIGIGGKGSESAGRQEDNYTINFIDQGTILSSVQVTSGAAITGSAISIPTPPSRDGYVFKGWYTGEGGTGIKLTEETVITITQDISFYAYWSKLYNLTVNLNGSTGIDVSGEYEAGEEIEIDAGSLEGYRFNSWTSTDGGSFEDANSPVTKFTVPNNDTTIEANWLRITYSEIEEPTPVETKPVKSEPTESVIIGGVAYDIGTEEVDEGTTTMIIDEDKLSEIIGNADNGSNVVIPISSESGKTVVQLVVKNVDEMAENDLTLVIQVGDILYNIPTTAIDTEAITDEFGVDAKDITFKAIIEKANNEEQKAVNDIASENGFEVVVSPVIFSITTEYDGQTIEIEKFSNYVSREIEITEEQAKKITTAIVTEKNGSVRHVPTYVYLKDGKYFAKVYSLTNSVYTLIYNEKTYEDIRDKWYTDIVEEMASRKIVNGRNDTIFDGNSNITRAEFTAMMVRALGLSESPVPSFADVEETKWYYGIIGQAYEYGLIKGNENGNFNPEAYITREEVMVIIKRAADITSYPELYNARNVSEEFSDLDKVSKWAEEAMYFNLFNNIMVGYNAQVRAYDNITRAECATVMLRLLQNALLIDMRTDSYK